MTAKLQREKLRQSRAIAFSRLERMHGRLDNSSAYVHNVIDNT